MSAIVNYLYLLALSFNNNNAPIAVMEFSHSSAGNCLTRFASHVPKAVRRFIIRFIISENYIIVYHRIKDCLGRATWTTVNVLVLLLYIPIVIWYWKVCYNYDALGAIDIKIGV